MLLFLFTFDSSRFTRCKCILFTWTFAVLEQKIVRGSTTAAVLSSFFPVVIVKSGVMNTRLITSLMRHIDVLIRQIYIMCQNTRPTNEASKNHFGPSLIGYNPVWVPRQVRNLFFLKKKPHFASFTNLTPSLMSLVLLKENLRVDMRVN